MDDKQKQKLSDLIEDMISNFLVNEPEDSKNRIKNSLLEETVQMFYNKKEDVKIDD